MVRGLVGAPRTTMAIPSSPSLLIATPFLAFLNIGATEILVIALLALVLFGAERIPEIARQLGRAKAQFEASARDFSRQIDKERGQEFRPGDAVPRSHVEGTKLTEEERIRRAARELGIETEGLAVEEMRTLIARRLQ